MEGLRRELLYDIAKHCLDITKLLFPQHWEPGNFARSGVRTLEIKNPDVDEAFERLLLDLAVCHDFRICLFVDGLDEFDERGQQYAHGRLATIMQDWTRRT